MRMYYLVLCNSIHIVDKIAELPSFFLAQLVWEGTIFHLCDYMLLVVFPSVKV
uniref:Uncharacterized protein n=1 Tax=Rhizophora mucronata TaxID=61149 RepID=A0A2P2N3J6_RHIMU